LSENGRQEDEERRKRKARDINSSSNTKNNNNLLGMSLGFEFCSSSGAKKRLENTRKGGGARIE
jgi:hypothetical protein